MATQTTEHSLDELAKGLATGTLSRGKAIRWMGGALLGAVLASLPGVAWANDDCRRLGRECRRDSQCCSRNCVRRGDDKVCGCPTGQSRCGDRCVNLKTNEGHCGSCSERCGTNQTCCNGNCVNLQRNENHCGRCGNRCEQGEECVHGECRGSPPACPPEEQNCCTCVYGNPTTGEAVSTCNPGFTGDFPECRAFCTNATPPPGTEFEESPIAIGGAFPGFMLVCGPSTRGEGNECTYVPCTTCVRNGDSCEEGTQCCSGNCSNGTCACKTYSSACNNNSECCSGYCNQFGICDQNNVECECQDGFLNPGQCTMAACGDTTALNQLCNSRCSSAGRGSGVAVGCFEGCGN